jgi:hypothetical protein
MNQMNQMNQPPLGRTAWCLGLAGLLPFVVPAALAMRGDSSWVSVQHHYGACILAFLGAVHWGPALNGSAKRPALLLAWGVVPSLMAWVALMQAPPIEGGILIAGLIAACAADAGLAKYHHWPSDYLKMRVVLTTVVCLSLIAGLA